ncbi:MAG: antitermination protein NusB [Acidobacteriaceae bacterium]|nr:antitermination protein NusB [Acidobacteriaceae bacterium]
MKTTPARRIAFEVLSAVARGGYASDILRARSRNLEPRDAGLASQIVFGCLRHQAQLDHLVFLYSGRPAAEFEEAVLIAMRMGIFQLRYLERIPAHAAVGESVELVKRHKRAAAGLVHAVLRKVNREPVAWPDLAIRLSCPEWLLERWTQHFGSEMAENIAAAALEEPAAYLRVPLDETAPERIELEPTSIPGCFRLVSGVKLGLRLHDISSQAIIPLLDLKPAQRYLDLCAAPGNKTLQALETPLALAVACDISEKRIREIPPVCPRVVLDAGGPLPFRGSFDRIFIDAPCSGTGTLARNPEIKWRVQNQDFARFAVLQRQILAEAVGLLAGNGRLVYATCSLEREENEDVVAGLLEVRPDLKCEREMWRVPGRDEGDGFYAAVIGHRSC